MDEHSNEVPLRLLSSKQQKAPSIDMANVVGICDILLICLDTLRYDVAVQEDSHAWVALASNVLLPKDL